jgi:hypothetical protein
MIFSKSRFPHFFTSLRVFGWLFWADARSIYTNFLDNLLDAIAWPAVLIFVHGFIMPTMGMPADYGAFKAISTVVAMGSFSAWASSMPIAADLAGPQTISYELTLPLPYWMVWLKNGLFLALKSAIFNITPLFLGKLILGNLFDFSNFSLAQFVLVYSASSLLFGMFALWSTVIINSYKAHSRLELRLVGPMFFLNGWTASWLTMYKASPFLGILVRGLPWVYAYEGCRAAALGQGDYINIWTCLGMLLFFTTLITLHSTWLFKKKLDCV